ncbi:MAG: immune inhibitor A [Candidatus Lokiarchaeota archaeon]
MRKVKVGLFITLIVILTATPFGLFAVIQPKASKTLPDYIPIDATSGLAGNLMLPSVPEKFDGDLKAPTAIKSTNGLKSSSAQVGDVVFDWYLSVSTNDPYMTCKAIEGNIEIWVANDLLFDPGDVRNADPTNFAITDEMIEYMAYEFNDVIYPTDTEYFGHSDDRYGNETIFQALGWPEYYYNWTDTDNPQRVMVKVFNIRDDNYYNASYPYYVVGFFSEGYDSYYNRNMIHIDAWRWWQRLGEAGDMWLDEPPWNRDDLIVTRPHVYESTFAHEYQHLIHRDWQPNPAAFMNEGCSMYAEFLCGYGVEDNYFNSYFATPDNSLTVWGDQGDINILADYGVAALWTIYLNDHYGGAPLIRDYVQSGIPGIEGINAVLKAFGYKKDFYDVYHDWRLANLIRSNFPGHGKYNYKSIDMSTLDPIHIVYEASGLPVPMTTAAVDFGTTKTILGHDTGVSMIGPFGSDYIRFTDWRKPGNIYFNGDDQAYLGWQPIPDGFWSAFGDLGDKWLLGEAYVDPSNPVLELITKYDIEPYWDFGFVQVFNETSGEWQSLENMYTTSLHDASALEDIVNELPGLTGQNPSWPDWTTMYFDLNDWAGQTVQFNFRYMTDWATTDAGWYINQASVSGTPMELTYESGEADFMVTVVEVMHTRTHDIYIPWDIRLCDLNEVGHTLAVAYKHHDLILVVSPTMENGFTDYSFAAQRFKPFKWFWFF